MGQLWNLARVRTTTTGDGPVTLGAAVPGFLNFGEAGVPDGATVSYAIEDGIQREVGVGVYASGPNTLTRTNVHASTRSGNQPVLLTGNAQVFLTPNRENFRNPAVASLTFDTLIRGAGAVRTVAANGSLTAQDNGRLIVCNSLTNFTLTVPTGLPAGFQCDVVQRGVGIVTIAAGAGVGVVNRQTQFRTAGQWAVVTLRAVSATEFVLTGETQA
jgi:hypothetical protein